MPTALLLLRKQHRLLELTWGFTTADLTTDVSFSLLVPTMYRSCTVDSVNDCEPVAGVSCGQTTARHSLNRDDLICSSVGAVIRGQTMAPLFLVSTETLESSCNLMGL
jgi:hypothetical protein